MPKIESIIKQDDLFDKISDELFDGVVMISGTDKVVFWNKAAEKMFGYSRQEIIGKNLHEIVPAYIDMAKYKQSMAGFDKTGKSPVLGKLLEVEAKRKNGEKFLVELSVSSMQINGQWHAVGIMRDISERKKNEMVLEELNDLMVGREIKMIELKKKVSELEKKVENEN